MKNALYLLFLLIVPGKIMAQDAPPDQGDRAAAFKPPLFQISATAPYSLNPSGIAFRFP